MTIKKSYAPIVKFLEDNKTKKVESILKEVLLMCESKKQSSTSLWNDKGELIAIYCYYHKQFELVKDVPYGSKKSAVTKKNSMCKVGTSMWTKKQSTAKKKSTQLLVDVGAGKIKHTEIVKLNDDIEASRLVMDKADMPKGFANKELVEKHTKLKLVDSFPTK